MPLKPAKSTAGAGSKPPGSAQGISFQQSWKGRSSVVMGRGSDCDIVIKDEKASRRHCVLTKDGEAFRLEDLGSKNGTYVEGARISSPVSLKLNQTFKIGDTVFYLAP